MIKTILNGKIHRAVVTQADINYIGSITIDSRLMEAAGIIPYEQVHVVDVTNGSRIQTYVIPGEKDSGIIAINGAAAHLIKTGDIVIIISYIQLEIAHNTNLPTPKVVFVDAQNKITESPIVDLVY